MIVADTDVLIDFITGVEPMASRVAAEIEAGMATTAVSRFELQAGARSAREARVVSGLLEALFTLPLDSPSADQAAEVRRELDKAGMGIGMADSLIAGIVLANEARLFTRNRRHFERVAGLKLAD